MALLFGLVVVGACIGAVRAELSVVEWTGFDAGPPSPAVTLAAPPAEAVRLPAPDEPPTVAGPGAPAPAPAALPAGGTLVAAAPPAQPRRPRPGSRRRADRSPAADTDDSARDVPVRPVAANAAGSPGTGERIEYVVESETRERIEVTRQTSRGPGTPPTADPTAACTEAVHAAGVTSDTCTVSRTSTTTSAPPRRAGKPGAGPRG